MGRFLGLIVSFALLPLLLARPCDAEPVPPEWETVTADPPEVHIHGSWNRHSMLITGRRSDGDLVDLTDRAVYRAESPEIVEVTAAGVVHSRADGRTRIAITVDGIQIEVPVAISGMLEPRQFQFEHDIEPILGRFGCNSSGCHGKAEGQNGFKLSVFGSDPLEDFQRLTREARGRRVFPNSPERSLLLTKASGRLPHGGGMRIAPDSPEYDTLKTWIAAGAPFGQSSDPQVVELRVEPLERALAMRSTQRLRVTAVYSDGEEIDVTHLSRFQSNNAVVCSVDVHGLCTAGESPGDAAVMAGYLGFVRVFRALVPREGEASPSPPAHNFVDEYIDRKLQKLNLAASELADDAEYLRRVYLDTIGTLPTAEEARRFLADPQPDKRSRLVDALFDRPEFADYWALRWSDMLRVDRRALGHAGAYLYYQWIRESVAANKPLDQFTSELIAAEGPLTEAPAGHFYKAVSQPGGMAATLSQSLLGIRIDCAQCHHHPFDRWSQSDYYGMQAFFTQVSFKVGRDGEILFAGPGADTLHPRTHLPVPAHALGEAMPTESPSGDRRRQLAAWLTAPHNPWFAPNLVNRIWAHYTGRGLVEPVDDVRLTNPPTNPELLQALASHFVTHGYDLRELIRTITASRTYQLSSRPNSTNERDEQNYSRSLFKPIDSEVLADAISQVTGIPEKFPGIPAGTRAIALWDSDVSHYFLQTFGRPERTTPCSCERVVEPNVAQVLHLLNGPEIQDKLMHDAGRLSRLARDLPSNDELVEELYLTIYSRYPDARERSVAAQYFQSRGSERRAAAEDLVWSLLNTTEFLFNH
ncbi:MAG: DUF1549 and DUF1553 domain-containing protein [Planctomycetaceae bacterium]